MTYNKEIIDMNQEEELLQELEQELLILKEENQKVRGENLNRIDPIVEQNTEVELLLKENESLQTQIDYYTEAYNKSDAGKEAKNQRSKRDIFSNARII